MKQLHQTLQTPYGVFPTIKSSEIKEAKTVKDLFKKLETKGGTIDPVIFAELDARNEIANYKNWRNENPDKYFADDI
jgi:hypothetical protein